MQDSLAQCDALMQSTMSLKKAAPSKLSVSPHCTICPPGHPLWSLTIFLKGVVFSSHFFNADCNHETDEICFGYTWCLHPRGPTRYRVLGQLHECVLCTAYISRGNDQVSAVPDLCSIVTWRLVESVVG